jgi:DHA1 family multidrug resistance protein-like MFS transporter
VLSVLVVTQQGLPLLAGLLSDRWGSHRLLTLGLGAVCVGYVGFALHPAFWLQLPCAALVGAGTGAVSNVGKARLLELGGESRVVTLTLRSAAINIGSGAGQRADAFLLGRFELALLVGIAINMLFWLGLVRGMPAHLPAAEVSVPLGTMLRLLLGQRALLGLTAASAGFWYLYVQFSFTLPLYSRDRFGWPNAVGIMFAIYSVVAVALQYSSVMWLSRRLDRWSVLALGMAVMAIAFAALAAVGAAWVLLLFAAVFSLGELLVVPLLDIAASELSPPGVVAGSLGLVSIGWAAGGALGNVLGGIAYQWAVASGSYPVLWWLQAGVALVTAA